MSTTARNIIGIVGLVLYVLCVVTSVAVGNLSAVCAWLAVIVTTVCLWSEENSLSEMEDALTDQEADVTRLMTLNEDLVEINNDLIEINNKALKEAADILGDNRELLKHIQGLLDVITVLQDDVDDYQSVNKMISHTGMKFAKDPVTGKWLLMVKGK